MQPTHEELFLAVKDDDYLSYNQLFTRFYRRLCLFVFDYTRDESASEDIVQELFLKLWIDRKRINIRETVSSYLYKFAKNAAFNYLRSEKNRQKVIERLPIDEVQPENDGLDYEEFLVHLQVCIGKLPERSKLVFTMNRMEEMKLSEIARKLDVSVKTIKNQLWKSLQYIRSCLQTKEMI